MPRTLGILREQAHRYLGQNVECSYGLRNDCKPPAWGSGLLRSKSVDSIRTLGCQRQGRKVDKAHWSDRWRINACYICGTSAIPLMWNGSTGSSCSLICVCRCMVLKVKCALLTRTLDEEKSSILEREESFVALGAKRHFPGDYSWHLASH